MDEIIVSRGSGKSALAYMVGLHKLYKSGKINKIDYLAMKGAALVLMFGLSEEDAFAQLEQEFSPEHELIRCEDCKHLNDPANGVPFCKRIKKFVDADWFCADGERQEGR